MLAPTAPALTDELAAIDQAHPRWHAWASSPHSLWATRSHTRAEMRDFEVRLGCPAPSGATVHGETPLMLDLAIAEWERVNRAVAA